MEAVFGGEALMSDDARFDAISGKLDIILTRTEEAEQRDHDILARLAHVEEVLNNSNSDSSQGETR